MSEKVVAYFKGDTMAASVWQDKYCLKDRNDKPVEETPTDMHWRMAKEFARVEFGYIIKERYRDYENLVPKSLTGVSEFGMKLLEKRFNQTVQEIEQEFFNYFDKFGQIVPQGSVMSNLGDFFRCGSLSNCFGIASPYDSYGGIFTTDQHIAQLEKRRGGVGANISTLRYTNAFVSNSARSSTGIPSFAERFSNTTREVAQEGRRGALMLLLICNHPDIFRFASMKDDRTKVTGANVSIMFTEKFMQALETNSNFYCTFPTDVKLFKGEEILFDLDKQFEYNKVYPLTCDRGQVMKIKPQELFDLVAEMAWKNGEPGVAYYDRVVNYCPEGVYPQYIPKVCNPCGEQWFAFNETCRLIAINFWSIVMNHFEDGAALDMDLLYELAYMQQRLGDNLVDLEVEYIDRILEKLATDPEPQHIKQVEIDLWLDIRRIAVEGRRTGNGFTALGDMLAAIGMKYDSPEGIATTEMVMKTKMRAELDCTIDMAILRGTFVGWDRNKEMDHTQGYGLTNLKGKNSFYAMVIKEFPSQARRMFKYGRRNTNWSTVAPTGTVSLMCQTTSGMEPLFKAYYIRRRKINPSEAGARVDFTDELGDTWQEYAVLHPKFKDWVNKKFNYMLHENPIIDKSILYYNVDDFPKELIADMFYKSPWYGSEADDISWEKRIDIQAIIQKYTSNAISSTINLPKDIPQQVVKDIYLRAYHKGLKGVTVYRDTSRSGVLITETSKTSQDQFGYTDAIKRPEQLEAHYYSVQVRGKLFAVIVGLLNNLPYELFAFEGAIRKEEITGKLVKIQTGVYSFISPQLTIENVQLSSDHTDEKLLTRMCSQLLRHGVNPKYIVEQVEKSEVTVVSFAKAIVRVLKKYIPDEEATGETCNECKQPTIIYEEGCKKCTSCGSSKC